MGFAAPWALLGLLAVAVPIVAHLLRRRDVPLRALPTIALLRKADVASRRRVRVVDHLLLASRIALVALAALALAAPFATATLAWGDGRQASVAIVIDDSMSMSRAAGSATLLDHAVDRAREVIGALPAESEVVLVLAGDAPRLLAPRTDDLALARSRLDGVRAGGARGTDLAGAIELATRQLAGARHPVRRVVVLSDHARHAGEGEPAGARDVTVENERIGPDEGAPNLALVSALATSDPTTPGQLAIAIEIRSFGGVPPDRVPVVVRRGVSELARGEVALTERGGRTTLHVDAPAGGDPTAEVALAPSEPDALPLDDRRGVLLRPASAPRVLMVDGDPQPLGRRRLGGGGEEVRFLAQALSLAPRSEGGFVQRAVDPDTFLGTGLDDVDVVVLANVELRGGSALATKITEHVERGGGLLVAAGDRVQPGAWARLESVLPARVIAATTGEVVGMTRGEAPSALLPAGASGLEAVRATRRLAMEPHAGAEVLLAWPDGTPALVLDPARRVAILGTTLDDAWSDLPYRPGFLPLAVRLVRALAPPGSMPDAPFAPGHAPELRAPPGATELVLIAPSGRLIEHDQRALGRPIDLGGLDEPGAWRVQISTAERTREEAPRSAFVIAPPAEESDLTPRALTTDEDDGAREDGVAQSTTRTVVRRSMAPWLFALVGLMAVAEGTLRVARARRERGATA
ncbi:vWA domain-containing protein [Sandaracinus amylolyticus]|uniref:vWA domain-containing protein n=1 Tax=Sandaracinus amylolyticus TaxID=927083 RepID=UPI001F3206F7|nr:BatA and WFA domain-containing protein [Sandaracinus amylolyticus]UJR81152.1 VWFA domain-containing protein [Sandaracinus amylolyticus]